MSLLRTYKNTEIEFSQLKLFCNIANGRAKEEGLPFIFYLDDIYFDCGQNWWYTAIITEDTRRENDDILGTWQMLCPNEYEMVVSTDSISEIVTLVDNVLDKYKTTRM